MYENDNIVQINWKSLLIKVAIGVVLVLLIIWLFPMPKLDTFYNRVYNENLNSMKSVAENYFTNDKLPKETGSTTTLKLQDMIDKKIISSFTDKNNNSCNTTNSFAQVTKTENDAYVLKVQLACEEKTDYVLENLNTTAATINVNCNNNDASCKNNSDNSNNNETSDNNATGSTDEDDDVLEDLKNNPDKGYDKDSTRVEYQYKKAITKTSVSYRCPDGYIKDGNTCYKYDTGETIAATPLYFDDITETKDALKNETGSYDIYTEPTKTVINIEKVCPEGYTLNGNVCYAYKNATVVPGTTTYSCTEGVLNGNKCVITVEPSTKSESTTSYYCPEGVLNGNKCIISTSYLTKTAKGEKYYTCDNGGTLEGTICKKTEYTSKSCGTSSGSYYCPNGGSLSGSSCYYSASYNAGSSGYGNCPSGWTANGAYCVMVANNSSYWSNPTVQTSTTPLTVYDNGSSKRVLANKSCTLASCTYTYYYYTKVSNYTCSQGVQNGGYCYIARPVTTSQGYYTCPNGGSLSGSSCYYSASYRQGSTSCSCPSGYSERNGGCEKTTSYNATKHKTEGETIYYCPSDYTQSGSGTNTKCTKTVDAKVNEDSKTQYYCPPGFTQSGSGAYTKCTKIVDAKENTTETEYKCEAGYVKEGTTCYKYTDAIEKKEYSYSCPDDYLKIIDGETIKCKKTIQSTTTYYCENADETLIGDKCSKVIKGALKGYECPPGFALNNDKCVKKTLECAEPEAITDTYTSYEYKWSSETYLDGWERTGKTRNISNNSSNNTINYDK